MKGNKLGGQGGSGSQEQPRMEIMKGDKLGGQGGSGSQEQPRMQIMKGDKLWRQGGSSSQEQPRMQIMKGDKLGRQGGSGITTIWRFRGSATQSLRSKNPYSFLPAIYLGNKRCWKSVGFKGWAHGWWTLRTAHPVASIQLIIAGRSNTFHTCNSFLVTRGQPAWRRVFVICDLNGWKRKCHEP